MKKRRIPPLPAKFRFSHNYSIFLHDVLLTTLIGADKAGAFNNVDIDMKDAELRKKLDGKSGRELANFLNENGFSTEMKFFYSRRVTASLLSDMLHFVLEALRNSKKGKLTVAYALLRKPFKESLFYLEWLLAEPETFMDWFQKDKSFEDDISRITPERKKEIIQKAINIAGYPEVFDADNLYELRYDKRATHGFEPLWEQANHLITNVEQFKTSDTNFNFVFSTPDNHEEQRERIYFFMPFLLFHTVQVVEALILRFCKLDENVEDLTQVRVILGFLLWGKNGPWKLKIESIESYSDLLNEIFNAPCPNCKNSNFKMLSNFKSLYSKGTMKCQSCKQVIDFLKKK